MTVAKGATIPGPRLLDAVEAAERSRATFERWAGMDAPDLPADETDAIQVGLARWQNDRFAGAPTSDVHIALGVIEELGEAFDEDAGPEESIDALGDVMVYAAQLCTANRLAIGPVIDLACLYVKANHCHGHAISIAGMLAHVALKHSQKIRGLGPVEAYRPRLVDALAMMIAKSLEDCALGHELNVDPRGVFAVIAREVMARKAGDAMIPAVPDVHATEAEIEAAIAQRKAVAADKLVEGVDALAEAAKTEPGDFTIERDRFGQPIAVDPAR